MSSSSSTIPARKLIYSPEDKFIRLSLVFIWGILILFGFVSLVQPDWLVDISASGKKSEALDYQTAGNINMKKGNFRIAAGQYTKAINIQPDLTDAYGNLGIAYTQLKRYDDAIKIFNHLLKSDEENSYTNYYNLAEIYKRQGNVNSAIECYLKSVETNPYPIYSYQYLGELYLNLQEWDLAIQAFDTALANKLTMKNSYYGLLRGVKNSSQEEPEILAAINIFLENPIESGHYDAGIFDLALAENREIAKTYNFLGDAFRMKDQFQQAKLNYEKALSIWPKFSEAKANLKDLNTQIKL